MASHFEITQQGFLHLVDFKTQSDSAALQELMEHVKENITQTGATVVLDLHIFEAMTPASFKDIVQLQKLVKGKGGRLFSINLPASLIQQVSSSGLNSVFGVVKDLESIRTIGHEDKEKGKKIDGEFLRPFIDSTMNVFSVQVGMQLTAGKAFILKDDNRPKIEGEVLAGTLSIISDHFRGGFCITVSHKAFLVVYESMFKEKLDEVTEDVKDALAEIVNMIYGQSKTVVNEKYGWGIQPALPTILTGNGIKVLHSRSGVSFCLPFTFGEHSFLLEISSDK